MLSVTRDPADQNAIASFVEGAEVILLVESAIVSSTPLN